MPNIGALLRDEIARLGRKEVKQSVGPLRKASAIHRKDIAELKRKVEERQYDRDFGVCSDMHLDTLLEQTGQVFLERPIQSSIGKKMS